jgi:hypothetical protein
MNILQALDDRNLSGSASRNPATWRAWRAFLALFGPPVETMGGGLAKAQNLVSVHRALSVKQLKRGEFVVGQAGQVPFVGLSRSGPSVTIRCCTFRCLEAAIDGRGRITHEQ